MSREDSREFHDKFRASPGSFKKAMETYEALSEPRRRLPRIAHEVPLPPPRL